MLKEFNIKPGKITVIEKSGNCKTQFGFCICSGLDLKTFHEQIGFNHPEKRKKLKSIVEGYKTFKRRNNEFRNTVISTLKQNASMNVRELNKTLCQTSINGLRKDLWTLEKRGFIKSKLVRRGSNKKIKVYHI